MTTGQDKHLDTISATRRTFLAGAVALPALASPSIVRAAGDPLADKIVINTLGSLFGYDAPYPNKPATEPVIVESLPEMVTDSAVRDSLAAGMTAVNVTVGHVAGNADPFEHTVADVARWNHILRQRSGQLLHVLSVADIRRAKAEGKIGVIYGFQNSLMLGDKPERVDMFAGLGLRVLQLTYNKAVPVGDGSTAPENRPLTPFGRSVVERANAMRVLCDLSHSGEQTCLDAIRSSKQPVAITHTGCRALVDVPRNKTDAELRLLADRGGYVGIYFMPFLNPTGHATPDDVITHIDHAIRICGEDHVGIGTDGGMSAVPDLAAFLKMQRDYVEMRRKNGIAAPGEAGDKPFFVVEMSGPEQFRKLERLMRAKGYGSARIEKILGANFMRVAGDVWGG